jgi:hypothetical protein
MMLMTFSDSAYILVRHMFLMRIRRLGWWDGDNGIKVWVSRRANGNRT